MIALLRDRQIRGTIWLLLRMACGVLLLIISYIHACNDDYARACYLLLLAGMIAPEAWQRARH